MSDDALMSLCEFEGEPTAEKIEAVVFKTLRERQKTTFAEDSEMLEWLPEEIPERNPWKRVLTALQDSKRMAVAESVVDRSDVRLSWQKICLLHKNNQDEEMLGRESNRCTRSAQKGKIKEKILIRVMEDWMRRWGLGLCRGSPWC